MKIKHLMIVCILLAIMTLGAVSASEDIAPDDVAASDEADVIADPDEGGGDGGGQSGDEGLHVEFNIDETDEWDLDDDDDLKENEFATVTVDNGVSGNITIACDDDNDFVFNHHTDEIPSESDEDDTEYYIYLDNLTNLNKFKNSKTFTIAFNDLNGGYISKTYLINHYDDEDGDECISFKPLNDFKVTAIDEFDVNNPDAVVISIYCPEYASGTLYIWMDDMKVGEVFYHEISKDDLNSEFNMTVHDLKIDGKDGHYAFCVYRYPDGKIPDWTDEDDLKDHMISDELNVDGRDYSSIWIKVPRELNFFSAEPAVSFYCADKSEGTVVVRVYRYLDDGGKELAGTYQKDIGANVEKWLYWSAAELGFEVGNEYALNVTCGDWSAAEDCYFADPVWFNEISYLESEDRDRVKVLVIEIPSEMGGSIHLTINGDSIELETSMFFEMNENTELDELYWEHPMSYGVTDKSVKAYVINNMNLEDYEFDEEGTYNITVTLYVDGDGQTIRYVRQGNVKLAKAKSAENDDAEIIIYDKNTYYVLDDIGFIQIIPPEDDENGTVAVEIAGREDPLYFELDDIEEDGEYWIAPRDLGVENWTYEIKVTYYSKDNEEIVSLTAEVTFDYGEGGIMSLDIENPLEFGDDEAIALFFPTENIQGDIVIKIDGEEYYRKQIASKDLEEEENGWYYYISLDDLQKTIEPGHYGMLEAFYYGADGTEGYSCQKDIEVSRAKPSIEIYGVMSLADDAVVMIYPKGDDSQSFRVIIEIDGEVYLNATNEQLNLVLRPDEDDNMYYSIYPSMLNRTLQLGASYGEVKVRYISDRFDITNEEDGGYPSMKVEGLLNEVEYDYIGPVVSVYSGDKQGNEIQVWARFGDEPFEVIATAYCIKNVFVNWDLTGLGLNMGDNVFIEVWIEGDTDPEFGGDIWVVNSSDFRAKSKDALFVDKDTPVFFVFCPEGSEGKTITLSGEGISKTNYTIAKADEGKYVGFSLNDLGVTEPMDCDVHLIVSDDGGEVYHDDTYYLRVIPFAEINGNNIIVLPESEDDENEFMRVVTVSLPYSAQGSIIITIDGIEVFNEDLEDIDGEYEGDYVRYDIMIDDLDDEPAEGSHVMVVAFGEYSETRTVTVAQRNVNITEDENLAIDMFSVNVHRFSPDACFAVIETLDAQETNFKVFIDGAEFDKDNLRIEIGSDENFDYIYLFHNGEFLNWGRHNVTVVCYDENDDEILKNNGTVTLFDPRIFVMWSNYPDNDKVEYGLDSDDVIHFYPNGDESNFRIVVMIEGKVYLNATFDELNLNAKINNYDEVYYTVGPVNFQKAIAPGFYNNVVAYYYSEYNWKGDSREEGMPDWVNITGDPLDPEFEITIPNVIDGKPVVVYVSANRAFDGDVIVRIGENEILVTLENGYGINDTTGLILPIGNNYKANLTYEATVSFKAGYAQTTFNVTVKPNPDLAIEPISDVVEGSDVVVIVTANDKFTGTFNVLIGDKIVATGNIANGIGNATISADKLSVGTVAIVVTTEENENFTAGSQNATFKVTAKPVAPVIVAKDASAMYTSGYKYSVTVYGTDGALAKNVDVVFKINGKNVATVKTDANGVATYKIVQAPGTYRITAEALGISVTKKLTVKHVVKLQKVKIKRSAKKLTIKVTLNKVNGKYLKKKKVTLKFKGKKYTAKTNKKGVAKFTIKKKVLKKLKKGKKVTYQATYLKDTVKRTVKVKK